MLRRKIYKFGEILPTSGGRNANTSRGGLAHVCMCGMVLGMPYILRIIGHGLNKRRDHVLGRFFPQAQTLDVVIGE